MSGDYGKLLGLFTVAIFGSFSCIWKRNKQKGIKNDVKNDVKNGFCEHPGTSERKT